jgi:2-polyprenyl-3-methyl-5-hydroxy-6-metoxy-1,4-benzoquinol methylase
MNSQVEIISEAAPVNMADDWYQYALGNHFWMQWGSHRIRKLMTGMAAGDRIFEIGCGTGVTRQELEAFHGCPVDGCDLNQAALEMGKGGQGKLFSYDINQRRESWAQHFSSIYLLDVLEHIDETSAFLSSVRFHLQQDGC